jgi:hypothetical protein
LAGALHSNACMRRTGPSAAERAGSRHGLRTASSLTANTAIRSPSGAIDGGNF